MNALADDEQALRDGRGAVWLDRDVVEVSGADAASFLQGQLSQDILPLRPGDSALSFLLQPNGKVEALVRVVRTGEETFLLDTDGGFGPAVATRLTRFKLRVKATIEERGGWRCVRVLGGGAVAPADASTVAVPTGWPSLPGMDLLGAGPAVPAELTVCDPAAYEAVRIEAGVPRMGSELTERTIPAESGVVELTVSFTKGCYTGQELVARIDARGGHVPRHLRRLLLEKGQVPPPGATIRVGGSDAGTVTSAAASALGGRIVALGYVSRDVEVPSPVTVDWDGGGAAGTVEARP